MLYPQPQARRQASGRRSLLLLVLFLMTAVAGVAGGAVAYFYAAGLIMPGVSSVGAPLGWQSREQAAAALQSVWAARTITLEAADQRIEVSPADLGLTLDAVATTAAAHQFGRTPDELLSLVAGGLDELEVDPVWSYDPAAAEATLTALAERLAVAPVDATIRITNNRIEALPAVDGRALDVEATLAALDAAPGPALQNGRLALQLVAVPAAVQDVSPLVAEAERFLSSSVTLRAYDPVTDLVMNRTVDPTAWGQWLQLQTDPTGAQPFRWTVAAQAAEEYLNMVTTEAFGAGSYLDRDATISALTTAVQEGLPVVEARVYHAPRQHVVAQGETLSSIGRDYGIPYPWIQQANPGTDTLTVGQTLVIPSVDEMLPLPVVEGKRVVVSLGEQRARVYENGGLKWDWPASTGIASSPTAPGVFQIQSHEPNAYASIWDLDMPSFMGIYRPVPTSDFMNGFHGFPTRGGSQLLWTGDLGHPVTFGCILLSSENAQALYHWAEDGVVVEVRP